MNEERRRADGIAGRLRHVEEQARASADRLDELAQREREANEKCRDQVNLFLSGLCFYSGAIRIAISRPHTSLIRALQDLELDLIRRNAGELRTQLDNRERELKELTERVEADDRVDTLERSLQGTQDRAEELEFQLSKVTQVGRL